MKHAYYLSNDLDELETVHDELVTAGFTDRRIHVLSDEDIEVENHHMLPVNSFLKTNVVPAMLKGAGIGLLLAIGVMAIPYIFSFESSVATIPFTLGGIFILAFSTWEAGFLGLHKVNEHFEKVFKRIHEGKHLMIVDYNIEEEARIRMTSRHHPKLEMVEI